MTGCIAWGHVEAYFIMGPQCKKDSNMESTVISRVLVGGGAHVLHDENHLCYMMRTICALSAPPPPPPPLSSCTLSLSPADAAAAAPPSPPPLSLPLPPLWSGPILPPAPPHFFSSRLGLGRVEDIVSSKLKENDAFVPRSLVIAADNTTREAKNQFFLGYAAYLKASGRFPGH